VTDLPATDGAPSEIITGQEAAEHVPSRRDFIHIAAGAAAVGGAAMLAWPFVHQMNPAADTLALATLDFDLSKVAPGQQVTIKWRGKPVFVRHRTPQEIAKARSDDRASMKDPQADAARVLQGKEQWLILVARAPTSAACPPSAPVITAVGSARATGRTTTPPAGSGKARAPEPRGSGVRLPDRHLRSDRLSP
jgi:ubiquinol-cytochrome c reductase iron-sulfur subunit